MAFSNAEKQRRHRERIKEKLKQAGDASPSGEMAEFRRECDQRVRDAQHDLEEYTLADLLSQNLGEDDDLFGPRLARLVGLPDDPWPGLMSDDLVRMTKGRTKEARRRGLYPGTSGYPVSFKLKLAAARHRAWLEGSS